jgi:hypothetical protein
MGQPTGPTQFATTRSRFASAARFDHSNGGRETWGAGVSLPVHDPPIVFDLGGGYLELHTTQWIMSENQQ